MSSEVAGETPLCLTGLTKRYGEVAVVDDLSATVRPGRITGFLGPNGAGKTTACKMLLGLVTPTSGSATFDGRPYRELSRPGTQVGVVLGTDFHPGRTGRDHLRMLSHTAGVGASRVDEVLGQVELAEAARKRVGQYSLGMRQRLALAGALLADPQYLILDEPANGLDPEGIRWLRELLKDQAERGKVVLMSSHLLGEVQHTVDDVLIIHRGKLIMDSPLSDLAVGDSPVRVRVHPNDLDQAVESLTEQGVNFEVGSAAMRITGLSLSEAGAALFQADVEIHELASEPMDLERAFFDLLAQADQASSTREGVRA